MGEDGCMSYKKNQKRDFQKKQRDKTQIGKLPQLRVKWIDVTPRNKIISSLNTGKIYLDLTILKDFYLIVKKGELKLDYDEGIEKKIIDQPVDKLFELINLIESTDIDEHFRIKDKLSIPGSTLKGTLRSRLELSFITRDFIPSCFITRSGGPIRSAGWRHLKAYAYNNNDIPERQQCRDPKRVCFVCNIFGTMGLKSKLSISDAILESGSRTLMDLKVRQGFSHEEVIIPGSIFKFDIYFENMSEVELGALFYIMNLSNEKPILIGSHRYALQNTDSQKIKFGQGIIHADKIELYRNLFNIETIDEPEEFIDRCIGQFKQNYQGMIRELKEWEVLPC